MSVKNILGSLFVMSFFFSQSAMAGVVYPYSPPLDMEWFADYGIGSSSIPDGSGSYVSGLYFGYTDNPSYASNRSLIPLSPKYSVITLNSPDESPWWLAFDAILPPELNDYLDWSTWEYSEATAYVPVGTVLTFPEDNPSDGWYTDTTLYRDVDGVPMPIEEFMPFIGDGAGQYVLDQEGPIDLVAFSFFVSETYDSPGAPAIPRLVHIHVVPEPGSMIFLLGLTGIGVLRRSR